jgi:hypothetical protein
VIRYDLTFTCLIHPSYPVEYADLVIIDLSKAATAEGRAELAVELRTALTTHGFFYIINHGYTQTQVKYDKPCYTRTFSFSAQTERMFDIADIPMSGVPDEEKRAYAGNSKETGLFQGYKPRQYWVSFHESRCLLLPPLTPHNSTSIRVCLTNKSTIIVRANSIFAEEI